MANKYIKFNYSYNKISKYLRFKNMLEIIWVYI